MGRARLASGLAVIAVVTALGALAGFRLAGPERRPAPGRTAAEALGPSAAASTHAYPMAVTITVRSKVSRVPLRRVANGFAAPGFA